LKTGSEAERRISTKRKICIISDFVVAKVYQIIFRSNRGFQDDYYSFLRSNRQMISWRRRKRSCSLTKMKEALVVCKSYVSQCQSTVWRGIYYDDMSFVRTKKYILSTWGFIYIKNDDGNVFVISWNPLASNTIHMCNISPIMWSIWGIWSVWVYFSERCCKSKAYIYRMLTIY